ncbi:MAG: urea ABC transporter permease subunit UrtB, partial [Methylomonas sp.]|nr:urea ABC transporter permease subunit UrtB [Methylomonas sp.]
MTTNHFKNDFKTPPTAEPAAGPLLRNDAVFKSLLDQIWAAVRIMFLLTISINATAQESTGAVPQPLEQLRVGSMAEREIAITQLAEDLRNLKLLQALQDGQLMDWKAKSRLVIAGESAKGYALRDPLDGKAVLADVERDAVAKLNLTNKLRGVLRKAIGGLQLNADAAELRLEAVKAIAKDADAAALQRLRKQLEKESDPEVVATIQEALWLQDLQGSDN